MSEIKNKLSKQEIEEILEEIVNWNNYPKIRKELERYTNFFIENNIIYLTYDGETKDELDFEYFNEIIERVTEEHRADCYAYLR